MPPQPAALSSRWRSREARRVGARLAARSFNRRVRVQTNFCGFANGIRKWNLNPLLAAGAIAFTIRNRVLRAVALLLPRKARRAREKYSMKLRPILRRAPPQPRSRFRASSHELRRHKIIAPTPGRYRVICLALA